ncbi:TlpA disulfide reductase family protein [uncultured Acetobacteroides sp.]|uniref:TlpA disulfide reductase family protein n=1 Tax=uncultured Acetobacteroides sp. TaxID=1760811 RepID=UPI0029F5BB13|nr:TlpA disulfide reductase family protein [uncultured Acetobacteroides sp.]
MNRFNLAVLIFIGLTGVSFAQSNSKGYPFTLQGKIIGKDSGKIKLIYNRKSECIRDSATIKNGEFVFEGYISEPVKADIIGEQRNHFEGDPNFATIYLEPGNMQITLEAEKFGELKLTGSKAQEEYSELYQMKKPIVMRDAGMGIRFKSLSDSIKSITDKDLLKKLESARDELFQQHVRLPMQLAPIEKDFIIKHPNSYVSSELLWNFCIGEKIPLDSIKLLYNSLNKRIQNSIKGQIVRDNISRKEKSIIGTTAPDFKTKDLHQQTVTLSQFRAKNVVLLDFWASWCSSCRAATPFVNGLYERYHSKGLEIVAISVDKDQEKWVSAIKNGRTDMWHHVSTARSFSDKAENDTNENIADKYAANGFPTYVLIDKEGKIVGRWLGLSKEELEAKLSELLK